MSKSVIVTASFYEPLTGGKGKFTVQSAVFEREETVGSMIDWAESTSAREQRELIRLEIGRNRREEPGKYNPGER